MKSNPPADGFVLNEEGRIQDRTLMEPGRLLARSHQLLLSTFGGKENGVVERFARAGTGLLGEQTHYSEGFAVLLTLGQGVAVAARPNAGLEDRVIFSGDDTVWTEGEGLPYWSRIVVGTAQAFSNGTSADIAVTASISPSCFDAYVGALSAATYRCLSEMAGHPISERPSQDLRRLSEVAERATGMPFSPAYQIAALNDTPYDLELIDTATLEHLPVEVEGGDHLSWAMLDLGFGLVQESSFHRNAKALTEEAIKHLKQHGFKQIRSFRELEHRDLQKALESLPNRLNPIARHLVTENRRVQKLVRAARQEDWQFFGALLFMSHASLRNVWKSTRAELDFIVDQAENLSMEGIYGACQTGRGGCVLIAGQPYTLPGVVREIKSAYQQAFNRDMHAMLL